MAGAYTRNDRHEIESTMEEVFTLFPRLKERINQRGGTLSGGEQQMLAVGRALMSQPKLLMLDEPSLGLAPIVIDLMFETIIRLNQIGTDHPAGGAKCLPRAGDMPTCLRAEDG